MTAVPLAECIEQVPELEQMLSEPQLGVGGMTFVQVSAQSTPFFPGSLSTTGVN
ncbi:MAG: hypothetical protein WB714_12035 [Candidatus Sulfotelmatobacter sp.]